jgi:Mrp family chromosome partitioning ATPase
MSALDRAFIKAYGDEDRSAANQEHVTAARQPQQTASRAKRSAAAAAIRSGEVPQQPVAGAPSTATKPVEAPSQAKPKMVVGRKALHQLAQTGVVPAPHVPARAGSSSVTPAAIDRQAPNRPALESTMPASEPAVANRNSGPAQPLSAKEYRVDRGAAAAAAVKATAPAAQFTVVAKAPVSAPTLPAGQQYRRDEPVTIPMNRPNEPPPIETLEVDGFDWSEACRLLIDTAETQFQSLTSALCKPAGGARTIAVVAANEGDGCTTATLCMALALAKAGKRVCVIDGDLRRPQLAEALGLEPERGLECVLAGEATAHEVMIESLEDGFSILPLCRQIAGEVSERPGLGETTTLRELTRHFDMVLVDAGAALWAHTNILQTGLVDAVILVGTENQETFAWQRARRALAQWNVACLGAIENRCTH